MWVILAYIVPSLEVFKCATISRPEIGFSVNKVNQFMAHPFADQWKAVKYILGDLKGTIDHVWFALRTCFF